jgi:nucleoid DNA-binding protein
MELRVNDKTLEDIACDIQESYYTKFGVTIGRNKIRYIIKDYLRYVEEEVAKGNKVTIQGHGTYDSYEYKERTGIDPTKQEQFYIETHDVPTWRSGKTFRRKVRAASLERRNKENAG